MPERASTESTDVRVLGIAGSLRERSYNRALLRACLELAPSGMRIETFERLRDIPPYDADVQERGDPEPVSALKEAMRGAQALLVVTPEYNFGIPGVLKNAIDWASRPPATTPLKGMPAGIMGASQGVVGTARAQLALRQAFVFTQTYPLAAPEVLVSRAQDKFDAELRLTDETTRDFVRTYLASLLEWTRRLRA